MKLLHAVAFGFYGALSLAVVPSAETETAVPSAPATSAPVKVDAQETKPKPHLVVTAKPSGLEFEIFNAQQISVKRGKTPATVEGLEPGEYRAIFRQPDSVDQRYAFIVGSGASEVVGDFNLQDAWQTLRQEIAAQQTNIDTGNTIATKVGPDLLNDLARASARSEPIANLLKKHGYTVAQPTVKPDKSTPRSEAGTPAPAPKVPNTPPPQSAKSTPSPLPTVPAALAAAEWNDQTAKQWTEQIAQLQKLKAERERLVAQSHTIMVKMSDICLDLLILAKTDPDAAAVVKKFDIKQANPAPAP